MVSCVELTGRNTRVDVRWFLSSLFVGKVAHPSRSRHVKIDAIAEARDRDFLLCCTCGPPIMPVTRAGSRVGPRDRGEADVTAIDHPRVSVALPVYNCERYVAEAIESILAQTFTDFEFLIVDDGSSDGTLPILHRFAARDSRIRVISRPNTGIVGARNEALGLARGELIAVMDSDDVALPERFEVQVRYLDENPDCVMIGSRVLVIDSDGDPLIVLPTPLSHEEIEDGFLNFRGQLVHHSTTMIRRRSLLEIGGYRPECRVAEDLTSSCD